MVPHPSPFPHPAPGTGFPNRWDAFADATLERRPTSEQQVLELLAEIPPRRSGGRHRRSCQPRVTAVLDADRAARLTVIASGF